MTDRYFLVPQLQLAPLARWVAVHGPKAPVLDVSSPPGMVCRTVVEQGRDAVCVSPRRAAIDILAGEFGGSVELKTGPITKLPLASGSMGSVVAVSPELDGVPLDAALYEFARVLEEDGLLVVAPDVGRAVGSSRRRPQDAHDVQKAVSRWFEHSALVGLSTWLVATLGPGSPLFGSAGPGTDGPDDAQANPGDGFPGVPVVVASRRPLPPVEESFVVLPPPAVDDWIGEWQQVLADLWAADARAQAKSAGEDSRDRLFGELLDSEQLLAEAYDSAARGEGLVSRAAASVAELADERSKLEAAHEELEATHEQVEALRDRIGQLNEQIGLLEGSTHAAHARVRDIQASTSWRVTAPLRRIKGLGARDPRR